MILPPKKSWMVYAGKKGAFHSHPNIIQIEGH